MKPETEWNATMSLSLIRPSFGAASLHSVGIRPAHRLQNLSSASRIRCTSARTRDSTRSTQPARVSRARLGIKPRQPGKPRPARQVLPVWLGALRLGHPWLLRPRRPSRLVQLLVLGLSFLGPRRTKTLTKVAHIAAEGLPLLEKWLDVLTDQDLTFALQEAVS